MTTNSEFQPPNDDAMIADFIDCASNDDRSFNTAISANDEMFHKAIAPGYAAIEDAYMAYMQSGRRMLDVVRQISFHGFGGLANVRSFLEFACGYGRFTRHLVSHFPASQVVVSDIHHDAVNWQCRKHNVIGVYSTVSPHDFALMGTFDIIFVGSLFRHLPRDLFAQWFSRLYSMLSDDGVIVFSVHDLHLLPNNPDKQGDFVYQRSSESDRLSLDTYGMTYVSESYVQGVISSDDRGKKVYRRFFKGLYENQDVYIVPKRQSEQWNSFDLAPTPIGGRMYFQKTPDGFAAAGWALSFQRERSLREGVLMAGDKEIGKVPVIPDQSGEILKFFPGAESTPVRFGVERNTNDLPPGSVLKVRFSTHPDYAFDVYLGSL